MVVSSVGACRYREQDLPDHSSKSKGCFEERRDRPRGPRGMRTSKKSKREVLWAVDEVQTNQLTEYRRRPRACGAIVPQRRGPYFHNPLARCSLGLPSFLLLKNDHVGLVAPINYSMSSFLLAVQHYHWQRCSSRNR